VPDVIGVKDLHYLDRTGLQQHRSIVDLMRYAAVNQGGDDLASYDGFIPADFPNFKTLADPASAGFVAHGRYGDEQLYALALYVYALQPPPNPNNFDAAATRGQKVFNREGCAGCHTPPLYTNNKLTLAEGFTPPPVPRRSTTSCPFRSAPTKSRSQNPARHRLLQGALTQGRVVSRHVRAQRLVRDARRLV